MLELYDAKLITSFEVLAMWNGWKGYALQANTYSLRKKLHQQIERVVKNKKSIG